MEILLMSTRKERVGRVVYFSTDFSVLHFYLPVRLQPNQSRL